MKLDTLSSAPFKIGDVIVDPRRKVFEKNGIEQPQSDLTWRFMMALINAAPKLVTYEQLAQFVWQQQHVSDETIAQRVRTLRQALDDDPKSPTYIRTVRGRGYQLIALVTEVKIIVPPQTKAAIKKNIKLRAFAITGVIALALITGVIFWPAEAPVDTPFSSSLKTEDIIHRAEEYRRQGSVSANEMAIKLYETVLASDETHQAALTGLAFSYAQRTSKYNQSPTWALEAERLADRAMLQDPNDPRAFGARGLADDVRGRVSSAISYYQKALELNPKDEDIRSSVAYLLQVKGKYYEALKLETVSANRRTQSYYSDFQIALALGAAGLSKPSQRWLEKAQLLRPDNVFMAEYIAQTIMKDGEFETVILELSGLKSRRFQQDVLLAMSLQAVGDQKSATIVFGQAYEKAKQNGKTCYACLAYFLQADRMEFEPEAHDVLSMVNRAFRSGDEWPSYRVELAYLKASVGRQEDAMESLQQAYALGYRDGVWLAQSPFLQDLSKRSDFTALLDKMQNSVALERTKIVNDQALSSLLE